MFTFSNNEIIIFYCNEVVISLESKISVLKNKSNKSIISF